MIEALYPCRQYRFLTNDKLQLYWQVVEESLEPWWKNGHCYQTKSSFQDLNKELDGVKQLRDQIVSEFIWQKLSSIQLLEFDATFKSSFKRKMLRCAKVLKESNSISKARYQAIRERFQQRFLKDYMLDLLIHSKWGNKESLCEVWEKYIGIDFFQVWKYILRLQVQHQVVYSTLQALRPIFTQAMNRYQQQVVDGLAKLYFYPVRGYLLEFRPLEYALEQIAKSNSIFSSPEKAAGVNNQLKFIQNLLSDAEEDLRCVFNIEHYSYQIIGSYSNQLALDYESRIDFIVKLTDRGRKVNAVEVLKELSSSITKRVYCGEERCLADFAFEVETGIVPFLKIKYKNFNVIKDMQYYATGFHIYVNQANSEESSRIVGLYAGDAQIKKLCLLVKLWARRKYINNYIDKNINGYILTIMTLYYLIHTQQASPILYQQQSFLLTHPPSTLTRSLYDNFLGWLRFFHNLKNQQNFHQLNLISSDKKLYSPCRLRIKISPEFYKVMVKAKQTMEEKKLQELFRYPKGEK